MKIILFSLLVLFIDADVIYQQNFNTDYKEFSYNLDPSIQHKIQMNIIEFPNDISILPSMLIKIDNTIIKDEISISFRSITQEIYVQTNSLQIIILNQKIESFNNTNINQTFQFQILIFSNENIIQKSNLLECNFPKFGDQCLNSITKIQGNQISFMLQSYMWNFMYYELQSQNFEIKSYCENCNFVISLISQNKTVNTILPTFFSELLIIEGNDSISHSYETYDQILIVGIYNLKKQGSIIEINLQNIDNFQQFPLWALILTISLIMFGIIVGILFIYLIRKHSKIQIEKPKIDLIILDKYIQKKQISKKDIIETCSICLVQYNENDYIRQTICNHIFHDQCFCEWIMKNPTCPICRTDLNEITLSKLQSSIEVIHNIEQLMPSQLQTQIRISDHDIGSRGMIINSLPSSNIQSHTDRISVNLVEDEIIEN